MYLKWMILHHIFDWLTYVVLQEASLFSCEDSDYYTDRMRMRGLPVEVMFETIDTKR